MNKFDTEFRNWVIQVTGVDFPDLPETQAHITQVAFYSGAAAALKMARAGFEADAVAALELHVAELKAKKLRE